MPKHWSVAPGKAIAVPTGGFQRQNLPRAPAGSVSRECYIEERVPSNPSQDDPTSFFMDARVEPPVIRDMSPILRSVKIIVAFRQMICEPLLQSLSPQATTCYTSDFS